MICGTETNEPVKLENRSGEWKSVYFPSTTGAVYDGSVLRGGPYDGMRLADLPTDAVVYVDTNVNDANVNDGNDSDSNDSDSDSSDSNDLYDSQNSTSTNSIDLTNYPEFDGIKYFRPGEFFCKCADPYCVGKTSIHMHHELLVILDALRERYGKPVRVTSGIRCPSHNAAVGGVSGSRHKDGRAADVVIDGLSSGTITAWANSQTGVRYSYSIDSTATHIDVL